MDNSKRREIRSILHESEIFREQMSQAEEEAEQPVLLKSGAILTGPQSIEQLLNSCGDILHTDDLSRDQSDIGPSS